MNSTMTKKIAINLGADLYEIASIDKFDNAPNRRTVVYIQRHLQKKTTLESTD